MKIICKVCGVEHDTSHWIESTSKSLESKKLCFDCNFWLEHAEKDKEVNKDKYVITGHEHYIIEIESDSSGFRGYGGAPFYIKFNDGRIVKTTNLWCQGDIPERFWDIMPDNAMFLTKKQYNELMGINNAEESEALPF